MTREEKLSLKKLVNFATMRVNTKETYKWWEANLKVLIAQKVVAKKSYETWKLDHKRWILQTCWDDLYSTLWNLGIDHKDIVLEASLEVFFLEVFYFIYL